MRTLNDWMSVAVLALHATTACCMTVVQLDGLQWTAESLPANVPYPETVGNVRIPARVPGDIHDDLEQAGLLPDLYVGLNSQLAAFWVPQRTWRYRANFTSQHVNFQDNEGWLLFDGVDYNCTILLNGHIAGQHVGSFSPIEIDVTNIMVSGQNAIEVVLHPPNSTLLESLYAGPQPTQMYGVDQCLENNIMPVWKSRLNFWDFATKMWSIGIWRSITFRTKPKFRLRLARIPNVFPRLNSSASAWAGEYDHAMLDVRIDILERSIGVGSIWLEWNVTSLSRNTSTTTTRFLVPPGEGNTTSWRGEILLRNPLLWWPNGYGEQNLYALSVHALSSSSSTVLDMSDTVRFGVRLLENIHNEDAANGHLYNQYGQGPNSPWLLNSSDYPRGTDQPLPDPDAWLFTVNGRKIFARGGNWVPADQMYGRAVRNRAKMRAMLSLARFAGYNYMRVWGGGLIEDQHFYDLCDEFGILLQQDFPVAGCGYSPPWSPEVQRTWHAQVPVALNSLANHPSVARYTLANEFYLNASYCPVQRQFQDDVGRFDGTRMAREADPTGVGQRHGPYTFAPLGGGSYAAFGKGCSSANQDVPGGCAGYDTKDGGPGDPFEWSEFGATAISDVETLRRIMPESSLTPEAVGVAPEWAWHKAGMWLGKDDYGPLFVSAAASVGVGTGTGADTGAGASTGAGTDTGTGAGTPSAGKRFLFANIEEEVRASQFTQAEAYRYIYQQARRRKWHRSLMASWTYSEPWPNAAHGSILDYYGHTKMAFYYTRQALQSVDCFLEYYSIVVAADGRAPLPAHVWCDSEEFEEDFATTQMHVLVDHFLPSGRAVGQQQTFALTNLQPSSHVDLGALDLVIPKSLAGEVILTRVQLLDSSTDRRIAESTYTFGTSAVTPLAPLLTQQNTTLSLGVNGASVVVSNADSVCALFVRLTLRENGKLVPYSAFTENYFVLKPNEARELSFLKGFSAPESPGTTSEVCISSWNAEVVCAAISL